MKFTQWLSLRESKKNDKPETKKEFFDDGHKKPAGKNKPKVNKKPQFE